MQDPSMPVEGTASMSESSRSGVARSRTRMNCRYCGALNSEHDHRCGRCGRRLYLASRPESAPAASRAAVAPVETVETTAPVAPAPVITEPRQQPLFPPSREPLRVVSMPPSTTSRRDLMNRVAPRTPARNSPQQRLTFPTPTQTNVQPSDAAIYCDAPVALPQHRAIAAAIDASVILVCLGAFLAIFYIAGVQVAVNKITLMVYGAALFATVLFYRGLYCMAGMDSPGTQWAGLRLVTFDGALPRARQRFLRMLTSHISLVAGGLGLLWALVDEEKLTWHDHMSKTFPTTFAKTFRYSKQ